MRVPHSLHSQRLCHSRTFPVSPVRTARLHIPRGQELGASKRISQLGTFAAGKTSLLAVIPSHRVQTALSSVFHIGSLYRFGPELRVSSDNCNSHVHSTRPGWAAELACSLIRGTALFKRN